MCGTECSSRACHDEVKQFDVSFLCVCPVFENISRHNIVKVAVDPLGDNRP